MPIQHTYTQTQTHKDTYKDIQSLSFSLSFWHCTHLPHRFPSLYCPSTNLNLWKACSMTTEQAGRRWLIREADEKGEHHPSWLSSSTAPLRQEEQGMMGIECSLFHKAFHCYLNFTLSFKPWSHEFNQKNWKNHCILQDIYPWGQAWSHQLWEEYKGIQCWDSGRQLSSERNT